jgi:hypothetical protein
MFAVREAMHLVHVLSVLSKFAPLFGWVRDEVEQTHEGHVTIIPHLSFKSLLQAVGNPSAAKLAWCVREGEHGCFSYINQIRTRTAVERALNDHVRQLRAARMRRGGQEAGARTLANTASCLQPSGGSRMDSLGRFVCPPSAVRGARPASPPPSAQGSPPGLVPDITRTARSRRQTPESLAQLDEKLNECVSVSEADMPTRSRSHSTSNVGDRARHAFTPELRSANVFTPGPSNWALNDAGPPGPSLMQARLGLSSLHLSSEDLATSSASSDPASHNAHTLRSVTPTPFGQAHTRALMPSPARPGQQDMSGARLTGSLSSSLHSLVAPLTSPPGSVRTRSEHGGDEAVVHDDEEDSGERDSTMVD